MDVVDKLRRHIAAAGLLSPNDVIVLGVSGGPDSVALLDIFARLRHEFAFTLHVAHFNHALRKNSSSDQKFVQTLAQQLHLPFHTATCPPLAPGSVEEQARLRRFRFFVKVARKVKADAVCLGHTRDDLAETVLMRVIRGTGLSGLRAILPQREIFGVRFVRPLLGVRKKNILQYLSRNKLRFRRDRTNVQHKFFRNKVRLELVPFLEKKYNKNVTEALCNLAETASADYDYLDAEARKAFARCAKVAADGKSVALSRAVLGSRPPALRRMILRLGIERLKGDTRRLTLRHMEELEDLIAHRPVGSVVHLAGALAARKDAKSISLIRRKA